HHNVAAGNARSRAGHGVAHHLVGRHRDIVQKAPKPHLLRPSAGKPPDTRAGPRNEGGMQGGPPFSSRRSPNRPSPHSIATSPSANQQLTHGITLANSRQQRCVHTIAARGE